MKTKFMLLRQTNNPSNQNEGIRSKMKFYFMFLFMMCCLTQWVSAQTFPGAPLITKATAGVNSALIYFTPPVNDGGATIVNYEYRLNGGNWIPRLAESTSSSLEINNLSNCSTYSVTIRAVNIAGSGAESNAITVVPRDGQKAGIQWTSRAALASNFLSVTYGDGLFVAVARYSDLMTSPDGVNWTSGGLPVFGNWQSVTWGNGQFVAVSFEGYVMTSPDGISWTSQNTAAYNNWRSVTYGNGLFVAVSSSGIGNRVMTSPDGITWTSQTSAADYNWKSVTFANGLFVAVAEFAGTNGVMTSSDGISWTLRNTPPTSADYQWYSVTYGNGLFVAVSPNGNSFDQVMTSPDGINWTSRSSASPEGWGSVTYGNGIFVAVALAPSGNGVMTSIDGINWSSQVSAVENSWQSVTYANGIFVAVAFSGSAEIKVMTSAGLLVPDKPVINSITPGAVNLNIDFTAPTDAGGSSVSNYEYSIDNGVSWTNYSPTSIISPLSISGLSPSSTYQVQLRAVNDQGFGCPSETMTATTKSNPTMTFDIECPNTTFNADPASGFAFNKEQQAILVEVETESMGGSPSESRLYWFSSTIATQENIVQDLTALQPGTYYLRFIEADDFVNGRYSDPIFVAINTPSGTNTTTVSSCNSYTWKVDGQTYIESGTYSSTALCGTEVLILTITSGTTQTTTTSACSSYTWIVTGEVYTQTGVYSKTTGCDTEVLDLTITTPSTWYKDTDNDGYSDGTTLTQCTQPVGYKLSGTLSSTTGDCNDNNTAIRPGANEICGDGIDNNCNGQTDEGCVASCVFTTFSQGGWATKNNPLTTSSFDSKFPTGLYIGSSGRSILLTSVNAVRGFLPNSGTAARLTKDWTNPTNKSLKNTFAGQLVAMRLNIAYNPGLAEAIIVSTDAYNGWNVQRLFDEANSKISSATAVSSSVLSSLSGACEKVNLSYHQGAVSGYVQCNPTSSSVKNNMTTLGITSTSVKVQTNSIGNHELSMDVFGNPTSNAFTIKINSSNRVQDVSMRVTDINGRVREVRSGLKNGQVVQFGSVFESGLYIVELTQEDKRVIQKLVKLK